MTDTDALLVLNHLRVGPITARRLMERFGSPAAIFRASSADLSRAARISGENANRIVNWEQEVKLDKAWDILGREKITLLTYQDAGYPALLREIFDYPLLLYLQGTLKPEDGSGIGIVGTRSPTGYGRAIARKWSSQLAARGFTIVSGLARGIDTQAHAGAIDAKGRTIAVLGYGFGYIYPKENAGLYHKILETGGAIISEYPYKRYHGKASFPLRNRLIAGLGRATVVVESRDTGGAMITAHFANEYNRTVFAVPGPVYSAVSMGTNRLIREGATLVRSADDITGEFEFLFPKEVVTGAASVQPARPAPALDGNEQVLFEALIEPLSLDELAERTNISIDKVTTAMLMLELRSLVRCLPGKIYDRR